MFQLTNLRESAVEKIKLLSKLSQTIFQQGLLVDSQPIAQIRKKFEMSANNCEDRVIYYPLAVSHRKPAEC